MNTRTKQNSDEIYFSKECNAILLISGKNLLDPDLKEICKCASTITKGYKNLNLILIATCFGHYDIILELKGKSARVLSDCACNIQNEIYEKFKKKKFEKLVCSSLIIGNKIIGKKIPLNEKTNNYPIKTYTFIRPSSDMNLKDFSLKLDKNMSLFWNPSIFTILLVTKGKSHNDIFRKILNYRLKMGQRIVESSTNFTLKFDPSIGVNGETNEDESEIITAVISIKLKKEDDPNIIEKKIKEMENIWTPLLNDKFDLVFHRAGGADYALGILEKSLTKIRLRTFELRNKIIDNISTSTILLLSDKGGFK